MDRRDFLKACLASAAAATFDFERALWIPKPMIVVPELSPVETFRYFYPMYDWTNRLIDHLMVEGIIIHEPNNPFNEMKITSVKYMNKKRGF